MGSRENDKEEEPKGGGRYSDLPTHTPSLFDPYLYSIVVRRSLCALRRVIRAATSVISAGEMRRGKVQLKPIEDKHSRQVTFSKRRSGLMKKAMELAVLCEADIAVIVFSSRGKVYEFSSGDSLNELFERYKIHMEKEAAVCKRAREMKDDCQSSSPNTDQQQAIQG